MITPLKDYFSKDGLLDRRSNFEIAVCAAKDSSLAGQLAGANAVLLAPGTFGLRASEFFVFTNCQLLLIGSFL